MQNSTRRKLLPREDLREVILEATDRLLARYGYKKMTIDDLAQEVGIGKGSIYLFFSSKEEIALSHIDKIVDDIKQELDEIAKKDQSAKQRLKEMLLARVLIRFDRVQHYTQSLNELLAALRPQLLARRKNYFNEEAQIFAEVIKEGQEKNEFVKDDELLVAETFLAATNSLLPYSLSVRELGERAEIEEKTERIADLLLKGLISR